MRLTHKVRQQPLEASRLIAPQSGLRKVFSSSFAGLVHQNSDSMIVMGEK